MSADIAIEELLLELGFSGATAQRTARDLLDAAQLTNAKKQRVAVTKRAAIEELLASQLDRSCARAACRAAAARSGRAVVEVAQPKDCAHCHGYENQAEIERAVGALVGRSVHRVVIVGGSPTTHAELTRLIGDRLELRLIDGTDRRNTAAARADLAWADLVVVWGATELDHKVSKLYTDSRADHVVLCAKRGISSLAATLQQAAERR